MVWIVLGWVVWAVVAFFAASQWLICLTTRDGGVKKMCGWMALFLTATLAVPFVSGLDKLHLLWISPLVYFASFAIVTSRIRSQMRPPELNEGQAMYSDQERNDIEGALNSGDKKTALQYVERVQERQREELRDQGIDLDSITPEIGRDMSWKDVVRQVFRVLDFDRSGTVIDPSGLPGPLSRMTPYGYLLVDSPILNQPVRLPIIHRDDFLLADSVFGDPDMLEGLNLSELLVTYAPARMRPDGRSATASHVLHYVVTPPGTLTHYYGFEDDLHMRRPAPEKLFGNFVYKGMIKVEVNSAPSF